MGVTWLRPGPEEALRVAMVNPTPENLLNVALVAGPGRLCEFFLRAAAELETEQYNRRAGTT